jgi:hypothetical protein
MKGRKYDNEDAKLGAIVELRKGNKLVQFLSMSYSKFI